jgi:hypothetical protein
MPLGNYRRRQMSSTTMEWHIFICGSLIHRMNNGRCRPSHPADFQRPGAHLLHGQPEPTVCQRRLADSVSLAVYWGGGAGFYVRLRLSGWRLKNSVTHGYAWSSRGLSFDHCGPMLIIVEIPPAPASPLRSGKPSRMCSRHGSSSLPSNA